jgi:hypothetical protein
MSARQSTVKLWYNFLQIGIRQGVPVNWKAYSEWGAPEEIEAWKFNRWWKERGRDLFSEPDACSPVVQILRKDVASVTVRVPLYMRIDDVKRSISDIVLQARTKKRIGNRGKYAITGQVNYSALAQYRRYLDIDFDPKYHGKTIEEKTVALISEYRRLMAKGLKQRQTLRGRGKANVANRFSNRDPEEFDREKLGGINPKQVSRWRLSGKHILLNVASGVFPGAGYYGPRLNERLQERLKAVGLTDIGIVQRARGGKKKRVKRKREAGFAEHALLAPSGSR